MVQKRPLVSIIIPCYNCEKWVGEALESCLNQTYDNLEIIIVDDGSTDESLRVIEDLHEKNPGLVRYYTEPNEGVSAARNLGVRMSRGDYFIFLDADDALLPDAAGYFVEAIREKNTDIAVGDWINFFEGSVKEEYVSSKFFFPDDPLASLIKHPAVAGAMMVRRNSRKWNEALKVNEIFDYFFSLFAEKYSIAYVGKAVIRTRQHISPERATIKYDHFNPRIWVNIFSAYKETLREKNILTFRREMVIDEQILSNLYVARRRGIRMDKNYFGNMNIKKFPEYLWYKTFGLSGFVYHLPPETGLNLFYNINRALGRA